MDRNMPELEENVKMTDNVDAVQKNTCTYYITNHLRSNKQYSELKKHYSSSIRSQIILMGLTCAVSISYGMSTGHSAVLLPELQSENSSIKIDEETGSWIASVYAIMGPVGCLLGGVTIDFWGRRTVCIIANFCMMIGWVVIATASGAAMLLVGRSIEGFAKGLATVSVMVLVEESTNPKYRGPINCSAYAFITTGIFAVSGLGTLFHWRTTSGIAAGLCVAALSMLFIVPESPIWLVRKNKMEKAERALKWIWGSGHQKQAKEELQKLSSRFRPEEQSYKEQKTSLTNITQETRQFLRLCGTFFKPRTLKPFLISHFFNTIQALCGLFLVTYYSINIIAKAKRNDSQGPDAYLGNIILSAVRVVVTAASVFIMFRVGRRHLAMISGLGSTVSALTLSVILFVQTTGDSYPIPAHIEAWVNFSLILIFCGTSSIGFFILPTLMIGEMQPAHTRSFVCGYIFTVNDTIMGAVIKAYPWLLRNLGMHGLFFLFGISCLVCTIFAYLFLPETKDKTLLEIEDYFKQDNILWITRKKYSGSVTPVYNGIPKGPE